ncbi:MAG: DUF4199 domain-containing protein [Bacteroidales bacterium]|jgi:hypothetical protein|nr:DUF4199 domain-containing protein [Bacteroidales bacterium]
MEQGNKYASFAFKAGSLVGALEFLMFLLMFYISPKSLLTSWMYLIIFLGGVSYAMMFYKKNILRRSTVKFGRLMALGAIISLVVSVFVTLYEALHVFKLDPAFIQNTLEEAATQLERLGMDASLYENEGIYPMMQVSYPFSMFLGNFIRNIFWTLVLSFFVSRISSNVSEDRDENNADINNRKD